MKTFVSGNFSFVKVYEKENEIFEIQDTRVDDAIGSVYFNKTSKHIKQQLDTQQVLKCAAHSADHVIVTYDAEDRTKSDASPFIEQLMKYLSSVQDATGQLIAAYKAEQARDRLLLKVHVKIEHREISRGFNDYARRWKKYLTPEMHVVSDVFEVMSDGTFLASLVIEVSKFEDAERRVLSLFLNELLLTTLWVDSSEELVSAVEDVICDAGTEMSSRVKGDGFDISFFVGKDMLGA